MTAATFFSFMPRRLTGSKMRSYGRAKSSVGAAQIRGHERKEQPTQEERAGARRRGGRAASATAAAATTAASAAAVVRLRQDVQRDRLLRAPSLSVLEPDQEADDTAGV